MKKSEIATIILIASLSVFTTFILAKTVFGDKIEQDTSVPTIAPISDTIQEPSKDIFNKKAINPTVEVYVDQDVEGKPSNSNLREVEKSEAEELSSDFDQDSDRSVEGR